MRVLIVGFFTTLGDLDSLAIVRGWVEAAGGAALVAPYKPRIRDSMPGAVDIEGVDPATITHVVAVTGPCSRGYFARRRFDLRRFAHCRWIGVNLSMVDPVEAWNPFHVLLERDSDRIQRPDLTLLHSRDKVPVIGLCRVGRQPEYGDRQRYDVAHEKIERLLASFDAAVVPIETGVPAGDGPIRAATEARIESLIARMDALVTTRLHGLVYALKNGVPAVVVDGVAGGGKVLAQARTLGWPHAFEAETAGEAELRAALDACLMQGAPEAARASARTGREQLRDLEKRFLEALSGRAPASPAHAMPAPRKKAFLNRLLG